jgi:DNA-binding MarR family transcriptional regulator
MNDAMEPSPSDSQADRLLRLVHWTSAASRHLRRRLAEVAESIDLSDSELLVVWLCNGGGRIQVELAGALGISPAQMSGLVERLRSRGLVAMHRQAMDRRRQVCRTTPAGQELLSGTAEHLNELAASVGAGLSSDEQQVAQTLCERLSEAVKQKAIVAALMLTAVALSATGCSRTFYRRQADIDAYGLVREKATHPHWRLPNYSISVDPRSRMYDPYAADCPPMPPDDPTSHQLLHCIDNKRGWPFWHDNGDRPFVENQAWPEYINLDDRGVVRLTRDDAVRLALLHSRGYQQQLETLYLSALDVSFERFRFDAQFFSTQSLFGTFTGPLASGVARATGRGGNSSSILDFDNRQSVNKLTTTGGTIMANFANSLVWQFSGNDDFNGSTIIDFAIVQPLLRDAGRDRVLERLTRVERNLLNNVRAMEQYRQNFYVTTVTGGNPAGGPNRQGGQFGGAGLEGFAGVGTGGFGQVGGGQQGAQGAGDAQGAGAAQAGNYLGLLQDLRQIRNLEDNVRRLRRNLMRLTTLLTDQPAPVTVDFLTQDLNVAQSRQALFTAESTLLNNRNGFQGNLDTFKTNVLSLPPQICIEPSDIILDQFELIQQEIIRLPEDWETLLSSNVDVRGAIPERIQSNVEVVRRPNEPPLCRLRRYEGLDEDLARLPSALAEMRQFAQMIYGEHLSTIEADIQKFREAAPRRKARLERLFARIEELRQSPCELLPLGINPLESAAGGVAAGLTGRVDAALSEAGSNYDVLHSHFQSYVASLDERIRLVEELRQNTALSPEELFEKLVHGVFNPNYECGQTRVLTIDVVEDISRELIELQLLQARARAEAIELQEVDLRAEQAIEVARRYRRDWMNARTSLVDSWRLVQFNADPLQSSLDVFFSGDIRNISDNPFRLRAETGTLRTGVQFDAPITRMAERNQYRQALIEYQQARRNFYNFEDSVARDLRARLRQLTTNGINFEIQRLAVLEAARQVILNAFIDQEAQRSATTRVTAARDAVQALNDLLQAQNNYMSIWINYEVLRLGLDFALGTMQLDNEGLWIDPGKIGAEYGQFDPWLWREMGGFAGHGSMQAGEAHMEGLDKGVDQLPPPFLMPPGGQENILPPTPEPARRAPRPLQER